MIAYFNNYVVLVILAINLQVCFSWLSLPNENRQLKPHNAHPSYWTQHQKQNQPQRRMIFKMVSTNDDEIPSMFPVSMRQALIEKAKQIDANIAQGKNTGSYSSIGWSNRLGTVLTPASIPGVYTGDRPFYWNKIDVGCRMTVIQLEKNKEDTTSGSDKYDLWVHSPVGLDNQLIESLKKLGTVKYVVSPNYEHLKFAPQWAEVYPDAYFWGCPGLIEKLPQINFAGEIPYNYRPNSWYPNNKQPVQQPLDKCWDLSIIQPLHINAEINPFTGKPFFNEVIYYHKPSQTLMATDFYWNYPQADGIPNSNIKYSNAIQSWELAPAVDNIPLGTRLWKFGMDKIYHPFYNNFMIKSKKTEYEQIVDFILKEKGEWEISTLIPAHGDIIRGKKLVKTTLENFLRL